jgi:hypothetical protein
MKILVITETAAAGEAKWNPASFETLVAGQQMAAQTGGRLGAAVIGKSVRALADELAAHKLDEVVFAEHGLLEHYTPDGFTIALRQVIAQAAAIASAIATKTASWCLCGRCFRGRRLPMLFSPEPHRGLRRCSPERFAPIGLRGAQCLRRSRPWPWT